jgi:hypothetical protein
MAVPCDQAWLFWDVNPDAIELARDRRYVLGRVLERGRLADVRWALSHYGADGVREFFLQGGHPELSRRTWAFWRAFFQRTEDEWPDASRSRKNSAAPWID